MQPTTFDVTIIRWIAPLEKHQLLVDLVDRLSDNSLVTGFVFAVPLFLFWHRADPAARVAAQRLLITICLATLIGGLSSLFLQRLIRWPPPATAPATAGVYAPQFHYNDNQNSFPSDSTMLYSVVSFGAGTWSPVTGACLLAWLLLFVAPARVFIGGHYPTDIFAGLLLGFLSYRLARFATLRSKFVEDLSSSASPVVLTALFLWLFEVGKGFADVRQIVNTLLHLRRHF